MGSVALVLNPVARGVDAARRAVEEACREAGTGPPLVLLTTPEEPGAAQARAAVEAGCSRVVVAGGDGTVREVVGAVGRSTTVGVMPCGTANLAARTLGLPLANPARAARVAVRGEGRPVDLGLATLEPAHGPVRTLPFLVVVGIGQDAEVLAALDPATKVRLGWSAYVLPGLRRLGRPGPELSVRLDDGDLERAGVWSLLAVNAARLPLGARLVPEARPDDGLLHVLLVRPRRRADWGRIAASGYRSARRHPVLRRLQGRRLQVELPGPAPVQVDGDVLPDMVRVWIELLPAAVRVATPGGSR
ncbi:diacylglycerol kinase family protein [uncultured Serinicoccus sp.]|uniref:diacylglycerol/lipid kinase family protein n=1 Tax=uncultured Serinicoccus sp. TaxID=735514 RepID=UPI00263685B7|nr:diacylglycerol kinase family protein [uncultured Serinicoccus sp.]